MADIGINIKQQGKSKNKCEKGKWVKIMWVGKLVDGTVISDSNQEFGNIP